LETGAADSAGMRVIEMEIILKIEMFMIMRMVEIEKEIEIVVAPMAQGLV
jgi:hypothetical protein